MVFPVVCEDDPEGRRRAHDEGERDPHAVGEEDPRDREERDRRARERPRIREELEHPPRRLRIHLLEEVVVLWRLVERELDPG